MTTGEVSVIGLGLMGSALASTLLKSGYRVTVWNRTTSRAEPLVREGAVLAPDAAAAVSASPIVLVCVADYESTKGILNSKGVAPALSGKVLVQLSTGTPQEARDAEAWARERGTDYLDGAIMVTPSQVGGPDSPIFASGARTAFERSEKVLRTLAGKVIYLGDAVGAASAWDFGILSYFFGGILGFLHGVRIFESENLRARDLGARVADMTPVFAEIIKATGEIIQKDEYGNPQASVTTCATAFELFIKQARQAGINSEFPEFALGLTKRAIAAGYAEEDFAAVIKVLRATRERAAGTEART